MIEEAPVAGGTGLHAMGTRHRSGVCRPGSATQQFSGSPSFPQLPSCRVEAADHFPARARRSSRAPLQKV